MAKISDLPLIAPGDIDGQETLPVVKGGATVRLQAKPMIDAMAKPHADRAQSWAEGTAPGGAGTRSAREYAAELGGSVALIGTALQPGAPVSAIDGAAAKADVAYTFTPAMTLGDWLEVSLDANGRPSEGLKRDGSYWRAHAGQLRQVYPDPRSLSETIPAPSVGDWISLTVDSDGRPVEGIDRAGAQYLAVGGVLTRVGGTSGGVTPEPTYPDTSAGLALSDWLDLTVDAQDRPVAGTDIRGRQYLAVAGKLQPLAEMSVNPMMAFGDSTTYGADLATPLTDRWTTLLAAELGRPIANQGISGQRAEEIAARMGAEPLPGKVAGGTIPATGSVQITGLPVNPTRGSGTLRFNVLLADMTIVRGTIAYVDDTTVAFTPSGLSAPIAANWVDLFADAAATVQNSLVFIGAGINNEPLITGASPTQTVSQLKGWYRKMTSALRTNPRRMVVWGMLDRGTAEAPGTAIGDLIRTMETWLTEEFGTDFCPVRQYLASPRALDDAAVLQPGFVPAAADAAATDAGVVPPAFRANVGTVHLGPLGHKLQTLCLKRHLLSPPKRWLLGL